MKNGVFTIFRKELARFFGVTVEEMFIYEDEE